MPITHLPLDHLLSSTAPEDFTARRQLSDVSTAIAKARRIVVVSGAGISCSSGIPDFRSADGLYSLVKSKYPDHFFNGKELFSSGLFSNPITTSIFYTFIAELYKECLKAKPTLTHEFISKLNNNKKLLRSYTQNVDGLERRLGLESGGRGKGFKKKETKNIELHGDLQRVRCILCQKDFPTNKDWLKSFQLGQAPECPACLERCESRMARSARATSVGTLRPSIVLYDEPHPLGDDIGSLQTYDLSRQPDLLLIMGTSLKVHGLKRLVKEFAKSVHSLNTPSENKRQNKKGIVVFVNATPPAAKEWEGIIDYHIQGETDKWVQKVEEEWRTIKPSDWETQTRLDGEMIVTAKPRPIKGKGRPKVIKPLVESDKLNEPVQLPTPRQTASPHSSPSKSQYQFKQIPSSPIPSSKLKPRPKITIKSSQTLDFDSNSELSDAPPTPPTPWSPSKRRTNAFDSPSKKTKSFDKDIPLTGLNSTPGKGNLFAFKIAKDDKLSASTSQEGINNEKIASFPAVSKENKQTNDIVAIDKENDWVDDEWGVFNTSRISPTKSQSTLKKKNHKFGEIKDQNVFQDLDLLPASISEKKTIPLKTRSTRIKAITVSSPRVRRKRTVAVKA
ncbi:uncharacterized protein L201_004172 [Kwoniella dendrophila CBS 6074]|uniref:Deacetylase sirtuin-type domain-containing protein n=1 Tax=Kwoniella dendrophila CBS 6074 TaxID=1295534 RepID=A0AAX4JV87_9TREE